MKQIFFLFRSSSTSRTVSSKSSCAIRKPPVISDELSSVTVQIPSSPKGYFQHRDIDPQSWSFMSPPLMGHLDPQHWQRGGTASVLGICWVSFTSHFPSSILHQERSAVSSWPIKRRGGYVTGIQQFDFFELLDPQLFVVLWCCPHMRDPAII